jgi:parallel beta-helix repeat protein
MHLTTAVFLFLSLPSPLLLGRDLYVKPSGNDRSNGLSAASAFKTIQRAADRSFPGDTVIVMDGLYRESVYIKRSGTPQAWIKFRARNRFGARVIHPYDDCFSIGSEEAPKVGYIEIDGFDCSAPGYYGKGVGASHGAHHIWVKNNYLHDCGESGIGMADGDYRIIENNICARNSALMYYCGSGISLWGLQQFDYLPGYHNIVRNNISVANDNGPETAETDGNGIIIDDFINSQDSHSGQPKYQPNYQQARTLVEGNLCFGNGGRGIQVFLSRNVEVRNNTCYLNNRRNDPETTWRGEISASFSANIRFVENIAVTSSQGNSAAIFNTAILAAHGGKAATDTYTYFRNLTFDIARPGFSSVKADGVRISVSTIDGNLLGVNPRLQAPDLAMDPLASPGDFFGIRAGSPARDSGSPYFLGRGWDIAGTKRKIGGLSDIGAFEYLP